MALVRCSGPGRSGGMADATVSNTVECKLVWVRIPPSVPRTRTLFLTPSFDHEWFGWPIGRLRSARDQGFEPQFTVPRRTVPCVNDACSWPAGATTMAVHPICRTTGHHEWQTELVSGLSDRDQCFSPMGTVRSRLDSRGAWSGMRRPSGRDLRASRRRQIPQKEGLPAAASTPRTHPGRSEARSS